MDFAYTFSDPDRLYLNVTNRCTNRCVFCVRFLRSGLGDGHLTGGPEPDLQDLLTAVESRGGPGRFKEIVWCGFGEPTFRLDLILEASPRFRAAGATVRLNTNGHSNLIHGRDVLPELGRVIGVVSVSITAPRPQRYLQLCNPDPTSLPDRSDTPPLLFWEAMMDFLRRAPGHIPEVRASVVRHVLSEVELQSCSEIAAKAGCSRFAIR